MFTTPNIYDFATEAHPDNTKLYHYNPNIDEFLNAAEFNAVELRADYDTIIVDAKLTAQEVDKFFDVLYGDAICQNLV